MREARLVKWWRCDRCQHVLWVESPHSDWADIMARHAWHMIHVHHQKRYVYVPGRVTQWILYCNAAPQSPRPRKESLQGATS